MDESTLSPSFAIVATDEDAAVVGRALDAMDLHWQRLHSAELIDQIADGMVTALVIAAPELDAIDVAAFRTAVEQQPVWSDLPILLLVHRHEVRGYADRLDELGQVRLVERPLDAFILERAAAAALRSRARQAGARAILERLEDTQLRYQAVSATLEQRVAERTEQLENAYNRLVRQGEERFAAEEKLRQSEELYRYTVELSQQIAWTADADRRIVSASPRFAAVTGTDSDLNPNDAWLAAIHPDDIPEVYARWAERMRMGAPNEAEFRMRVADGSYRLFRARATPRTDDRGQTIRWYGYTEDIHDQRQAETARRQVEEQLRDSEELYRSTIELSRLIVWTAEGDGTNVVRSPRFRDVTGLEDTAFPSARTHPDDRVGMESAWAASVASGEAFLYDFRLRMIDGAYRHFRSRAAPRRDETGNVLRWYGMSEDIHDRKMAEQAHRYAEERYRLAARATDGAVWDHDLVANKVYWIDSISAFLGLSQGEGSTSSQFWIDNIHPDDRDRVVSNAFGSIEQGLNRWSSAYRFRNQSGHYIDVQDHGFLIRDENGKPARAVGSMTDVTDRRAAEAQLQRMQAELIHVSRVSAMGTMASTLAHELNQPLTAVTSYIGGSRRLLKDIDHPTVEQVRGALESAEAGALRAGQIVRGLRELVARGNVTVKPEQLPRLVEDAGVLAFVDEHLLGVSHRIEIDPAVRWVDADRIQIQQVLINLIRNSVQAMGDQPIREVIISAAAATGGMVEISVADTGIGLTAEVRDALFSPFRSTKAEGMGIGLSISRTIVEAHGGKIWAEDRDGGGAVFRFTVPRSEEPGTSEAHERIAAE